MKRLAMTCLLMVGFSCGTQAADDLRGYISTDLVPGTPTYWNWSGFYAGGQWGVASSTLDPGKATSSIIGNILRLTTIEAEARVSEWPQLPRSSISANNYGGFIGFNSQWDDIVLGLELNYSAGRMSTDATDAIGRSFTTSDGYLYNVFVNSAASVSIRDYGTLRARAGYVLGRFLPYALVGAAIGRADLTRTVTVALTGTDTNIPPGPDVALGPVTQTESKANAFIYGFSVGAGLDVAITENIFLRGEYEYLQFYPFSGALISINTGRLGVALKF